jgi:hypothetical protein
MAHIPFDGWSVWHFLMGILCRFIVFPKRPCMSLFLSNLAHGFGEVAEHKLNPYTGEVLEIWQNNVTDVVLFLVGWLLGHYVAFVAFPKMGKFVLKCRSLRAILAGIVALAFLNGLGREICPCSWPYEPAYDWACGGGSKAG